MFSFYVVFRFWEASPLLSLLSLLSLLFRVLISTLGEMSEMIYFNPVRIVYKYFLCRLCGCIKLLGL